MAGPCRFWAQGNCRNGDNCKFQHGPVNQGYQGGGGRGGNQGGYQGGYQTGNRYAPLQNQDQQRNNGGRQPAQPPRAPPYQLEKPAIVIDLSSERPQWPLSSYGPGRFAPAQVFGGPIREQSFEEMRLKHYMAVAAGNPQDAVQEAEQMVRTAEIQRQEALNDVDAVIKYIIDGENSHPNRLDILRNTQDGTLQQNPFNSTPPSGAFGAPSQTPNPFAAPINHLSTASAQSGSFGQPSAHIPAVSAPGFGGPSQLGGVFSQELGQRPSPFASTSNPAPFSAFAQAPSVFSASSVQPAASSFGAPSQISNPFTTASTFGAPSPRNPFGNTAPSQLNPFGTTPAASNPFNASSQPNNVFGSTPAPSQANPFNVASSNQPPRSNPFGQPSGQPIHSRTLGGGGQPSMSNGTVVGGPSHPYTAPRSANPPIASYTSRDGTGTLTTFKGKRVVYKGKEPGTTGADGKWRRICFPEGPPQFVKDAEVEEELYDDDTRQAFEQLRLTGSFPNNEMPLLPPRGEWVRWDF